MASLEGRTALITGAGRGLGRSHAELMSKRGADVVVHDINGEGAHATAEQVRANGRKAHVIENDIRDVAALNRGIAEAEEALGGIDILVNNAGVSGDRLAMEDIDETCFTRLFDIHVKGTFFAMQAVLPGMKARRYGRIVNTASVYGMAGNESASHYSGAKGALLGLTKSWAREFAPFNIKVNAVAPGFIETDMTRAGRAPEYFTERAKTIPLQRNGVPLDISYAVAWLASDEADYVTGQVISPNGGWVIVGI